jgi:ribonuclease HI
MQIFTDGGCSGNPGPGGWAYLLVEEDGSKIEEKWGAERNTTNNRMELLAVINGLKRVGGHYKERFAYRFPGPEDLSVTTDSAYVRNGITSWIKAWKQNGWMTSSRKPVKNQDLWEQLDELNERLEPEWYWIKGHAGYVWNERCDELTQIAIASIKTC